MAAGLAALALLAGCSLTVPVSGTSDAAGEIFTGSATGYITGDGELDVASSSGVTCTGDFHYVERGRLGNGAVRCSDGREGDLVFQSTGQAGYGYALMSDAGLAQFLFGKVPNPDPAAWSQVYARFRALSARMAGQRTYCGRFPHTPGCTGRDLHPVSAMAAPDPVAASGGAASGAVSTGVASIGAAATAPDPLADLAYRRAAPRPDDVAVIVGNADYRSGDIPAVPPARNDAAAVRRYVVEGLGVRPDNIIELTDATAAQLAELFGTERDPRGKLYDWVRPGRSRVFVYYAGHGAPSGPGGSPMLVPVDASASAIALSGYPLATLYANLSRLPAAGVTVVLESCFSGTSAAGTLVPNASPVAIVAKPAAVPPQLTVIAAGAADQIASWEPDRSHGLFTEYFLKGMAGAADRPPGGNGDGTVSLDELRRYLGDTVPYYARRYWGRDQTVTFNLSQGM